MKRGKSQYSIEFLVTYGWALLIIGVIMGVIYSFGWLDPSNFLPQKCTFYGQIGCKDFYLSQENFNLTLINNFGVDLYVKGLGFSIGEKEIYSERDWEKENLKLWKRGSSVKVGLKLNLTDPSVKEKVLDNIFIGKRSEVFAKVHYYSNLTCSDCWDNKIGFSDCSWDCVHNATGKVLVKVSRD